MRGLAMLLALVAGMPALAHPHLYVDQQVRLSLGLSSAEAVLTIVPSVEDGAAIFDYIDADANGKIDAAETAGFGQQVTAAIRLIVDGTSIPFAITGTTLADRALLAAGAGRIELQATAEFALSGPGPHDVEFAVWFYAFDHDWFVQPFYFPDLVEAAGYPDFTRSEDGSRVTFHIEPTAADPGGL